MRKQYHFWPGSSGLDAWDVDRLVELSLDLPVVEVPVDSIGEVDSNYWFGGDFEEPTVRKMVEHMRLVRDVDPMFPIILGVDGRVMDGMHRIARALLEGRPTIRAVRFETQPMPDFQAVRLGTCPTDSISLITVRGQEPWIGTDRTWTRC